MICECGNPKRRRSQGCDNCQRIERERKAAESPTAAILNAISRLDDWPSAVEIAAWAGIDSADCSARLNWLKKKGRVESRWERGFGMVYRIKEAA